MIVDPAATLPRQVAAFDVDGTLVVKDSFIPFLEALCGRMRLGRAMSRAALATTSRDQFKHAVLRATLAGRSVEEIEQAAAAFFSRWTKPNLSHDLVDWTRWHRSQDHDVLIVSATPALFVEPLARHLDATANLSTTLETERGLLTGRIVGENCRGQEKAVRVRNFMGPAAASTFLHAYGDSSGDRAMLAMAHRRVWVRRGEVITSTPTPEELEPHHTHRSNHVAR